MIEELTPATETVNNGTLLMKKIAEDSSLEGLNVNGDKLINKTKLFLVAQASNELNRIIKLTNLLDKLEDRYIDTINSKLEESPSNLPLITSTMEVVTESLKRSNELISQILKDDKLTNIVINTTNLISADGSSATVMSANSRDAVRNLASAFLAQLNHLEDIENNDKSEDSESELIIDSIKIEGD